MRLCVIMSWNGVCVCVVCCGECDCFFNVNFNVFFKLIKVHLLVSELYIYQNAR